MAPRKKALIVFASGVAVAFVAFCLFPEREPHYGGRSLSEWLHLIREASHKASVLQWSEEEDAPAQVHAWQTQSNLAAKAIQEIGLEGLSYAVDRICYEPYGATQSTVTWLRKVPRLGDWIFLKCIGRQQQADEAVRFFVVLGPRASPAIPRLLDVLKDRGDRMHSQSRALASLVAIKDEALPFLVSILADPEHPARMATMIFVGNINGEGQGFGLNVGGFTNLSIVVPPLINLSTDANPWIAATAVEALGKLRLEPQIVVPTLTNALKSEHEFVRQKAVFALEQFRDSNGLKAALLDSKVGIRVAATNALAKISEAKDSHGVAP